ncbi:MAG: hypothetical protein AAF495_23080 [Pseudomonadota bacterium]
MRRRDERWAIGLGSLVLMSVICFLPLRGYAGETVCQKKAESLGWAIGCGCLKHDVTTVEQSLPALLPACRSEGSETLANSLVNGLQESADHDEHNLVCLVTCKTTNWHSVSQLIRQWAYEESI